MSTIALSLPMARRTPVRIPRRDLALQVADDTTLQLTVTATDEPASAAQSLAATGTTLSALLWYPSRWWDYGWPWAVPRSTLATVAGTVTNAAAGRADFVFARDLGALWPERLVWALQLDLGGTTRTTLAWGSVNLGGVPAS